MTTEDVISDHEVRIFRLFSSHPKRWLTNGDIAREAGVSPRTARQYTRRWTDSKLLHEAQVFPGYRYQWTGGKDAYVGKLQAASDVLRVYDAGLKAVNTARTTGDISDALTAVIHGLASGKISAKEATQISRAAGKRLSATDKMLRKDAR